MENSSSVEWGCFYYLEIKIQMKNTFLLLTTFCYFLTYSQETTTPQALDGFESEKANKSYKGFVSENGAIVRREVVRLDDLKLMGSLFGPITLETGIEKVSIGDKTEFYYNIVGYYNYRFYDAHIPRNQLKQVIDALDVMLKQSAEDKKMTNKSINNYFVTDDDFYIGYRTGKVGKNTYLRWYVGLERYGLISEFEFWKEVDFFKAAKSMKTAYESLNKSG